MYQVPRHQREVDTLQAALRRERQEGKRALFRPPPAAALGGVLVGDPILVARHAAALQDIDLIGQTLGHLARIVAAADKPAAAERVTLAELKCRLQRKPLLSIVPQAGDSKKGTAEAAPSLA